MYSGAGVIPIVIIRNKPYFVLFMLNRGKLTDAGGRIEDSTSIIDTASRELFEESAGLFNINSNILHNNSVYIDIKNDDKYYRSYISIIDKFDKDYYYTNLKKIRKYIYSPFSETRDIQLISLEYIHFINNIWMNTKTNKILLLSNRTSKILERIHNKFNNLKDFFVQISTKINPIELKLKKIEIESYTYSDHKKFSITNLDTYII